MTAGIVQFADDSWQPVAASSACADVIAAFTNDQWHLANCSADPAVVGTTFSLIANDGSWGPETITIAVMAASPSGASSGSISYDTWQQAAAAQEAKIATLKTQFETLQTTIGSNGVDPDTIQASTVLFGVVLVAAAIVWGVRRLLDQFREPGGHE